MQSETQLSLSSLSPMTIADLLLLVMTRRSYNAILIEPGEETHRIVLEPGAVDLCEALPAGLGDAVVARLCMLAGVPLAAPSAQFGRIQARYGDEEVDLFFGVRPANFGLSAELWKLAHKNEQPEGTSIDQYEIVGELGTGGMGVVYRAVHKPLNRPVAIKILHERYSQDPLAVKRFVREARAASRLNHPGIVSVYDFGIAHDNRSFLVMELVEGSSLRALLKEPVAPLRAVRIMQQMVTAIGAVHEVGIVHRDLKPENVFLTASDVVKIGDFGAAKDNSNLALTNITQPGLIFGTPSYMSPEHIQGLPTDHRTDLYALGCIFYELLTGKPPYRAKSALELFHMHVTANAPKPESPLEPLPAICEKIVERALEKSCEDRYQSAQEMRADLDLAESTLARNSSRSGWRRWLGKVAE